MKPKWRLINCTQFVRLSLLTSSILVLIFSFSTQASAATSVNVSATVPEQTAADTEAPTAPVLISPSNNSYSTTNKPTLVWQAATDNVALDHYELFIDGANTFSLPLTATENSNYKLTYNSTTQRYSLTLKNNLSDASHTWKVRAVDTSANTTDSATWNFTVDTQAPSFVVSQVGELTTSISAQDAGTHPTSPLELENNEPLLVASGEPNSSVQVTVTIPDDPTQNYTVNIDGGGNWSLQLGIFDREKVINLDFIITDAAGNVSVLSDLEFIILQDVIVIGPTSPSPTASPTTSPAVSPSPTPTSSASPPAAPSPTPVPTPRPSPIIELPDLPGIPSIEIPVVPPREGITRVYQELSQLIPQPIQQLAAAIPEPIKEIVNETSKAIAPVSAAVVATAVPVATSVAVASQFGWQFLPQAFVKILQSLGLIPKGKPQGMVFNSQSYEPIPFALLTIQSTDPQKPPIVETVVTDVDGVYGGIKLAPDNYSITVSHQDFSFPSAIHRPNHLGFQDFYQGEEFQVTSEKEQQLFLIPVDPLQETQEKSWRNRLRIFLSRLNRTSTNVQVPLFAMTAILTILYPTLWNRVVLALYGWVIGHRLFVWFKTPLIVGLVADENQQPLDNAIVRLINPETNELVAVSNSNEKGRFEFFVPKSNYQIDANKSGFLWYEDTSEVMSSHMVEAQQRVEVLIAMKNSQDVYQDLFN